MILNKGPPSEFETSNEISNSGGTDMYIEHPYFYEGKYYANIDGEMIEMVLCQDLVQVKMRFSSS